MISSGVAVGFIKTGVAVVVGVGVGNAERPRSEGDPIALTERSDHIEINEVPKNTIVNR